MKCVFNKIDKKFTGTSLRWDTPSTTADEVVIELPDTPDNTIRLNATLDGTRFATQTELDADVASEKDAQVEAEFTPALIAILKVLSPGNSTALLAQAKAARRVELDAE